MKIKQRNVLGYDWRASKDGLIRRGLSEWAMAELDDG